MAVPEPSDLVKDIAPWVLGDEWPKGDEDAMVRLAEMWATAANDVDAAMKAAAGAAKQARASLDGPSARRFDEVWATFTQGDEAAFTKLKNGSAELAKACRSCAAQIEYAKLSIRAALAAMVVRVISMVAAAFATSGGSLAGIMPAQLATRQVVVTIFRDLVRRLGEQVDEGMLRRMLFSVATEVPVDVLADAPVDAGLELFRLAQGTSPELDAAKSGAISGVLGGPAVDTVGMGDGPGQAVARSVAGASSSAVEGAISGSFSLAGLDFGGVRQHRSSTVFSISGDLDLPAAIEPTAESAFHRVDLLERFRDDLSIEDIADVVRATGWDGRQPVLLVGSPAGVAAALARELGGDVTAPTKDAWVDERGNLFASGSRLDPRRDFRPGWPPRGAWATVKPDGTVLPYTQSPPGHTPDWRDTGENGPSRAFRRGEFPAEFGSDLETHKPPVADRMDVRTRTPVHPGPVEAYPVRTPTAARSRSAPPDAPPFFQNRPDFRATPEDLARMRQEYPPGMWDRDSADIDRILDRHPHLRHIPREELVALRGYTAIHSFEAINTALRDNDIETLRQHEARIRCASSALNKMPVHTGVVTRVLRTRFPELRAASYKKDTTVTERAFTSCSRPRVKSFQGLVKLYIKSYTGRDISALSHTPAEQEVLFGPGTRFRVTGTGIDPATGTHHIQLEEIPPPRPRAEPQPDRHRVTGNLDTGPQQEPGRAHRQPLRRPDRPAPVHAPPSYRPSNQSPPTVVAGSRADHPEDHEVRPRKGKPLDEPGDRTPADAPSSVGGDDSTPEEQQRPRYTVVDVYRYLDRPEVQAALNTAAQIEVKVGDHKVDLPVRDVITARLGNHPELVQVIERTAHLERSLLHTPKTLASLLVHPEAIPQLIEAATAAETPGQEISDTDDPRQPGHEEIRGRLEDETAVRQFLDGMYETGRPAQEALMAIVDPIAENLGGQAEHRDPESLKDVDRALENIKDDYRGDPSRLLDLVGSMIVVDRVDQIRDALAALRDKADGSDFEIVRCRDGFRHPRSGGYREIQMNVRLAGGHIGEIRLRLKKIEDVTEWDHVLDEVRRDLQSIETGENSEMSAYEEAMQNAVLLRLRTLCQNALNEPEGGSEQ